MSSALHVERLVPCLIAVLLVTAGVSVPAVAGSASADSTADAASDPEVRLTETLYHEQRGDVFEIGVSLSGTDAGTVRFNPDANDSATVVVQDEDGDGRATVLLNTYDWTFAADGNDSLTVREPATDSLVADGDVDAVAHPGTDTDQDPMDVATLVVSERVTDDLRTWVAPESTDLRTLYRLDAAMAAGNLTLTDAVTRNDTLVLELRASGLEGALAAQDGSNETVRFFGLLGDGPLDLEIVHINPGPSVPPKEINLAPNSTHAVADPRNDTYYLVADLSDVNVTDSYGGAELSERDEYEANFSVAESSELASNGTESVTATFDVAESRDELADATTAITTTRSTTETSLAASTTSTTTDELMQEATSESPTATTDATEARSPTDGEIPGFGVGAALVAVAVLLAVAVLARRR